MHVTISRSDGNAGAIPNNLSQMLGILLLLVDDFNPSILLQCGHPKEASATTLELPMAPDSEGNSESEDASTLVQHGLLQETVNAQKDTVTNAGHDDDDDDDDDTGEEAEEDDDDEDEEEEEEPRLKYESLTKGQAALYRNGDAASAFLVTGDKMVGKAAWPERQGRNVTKVLL